jgi:uncharacterized protein (DUF433 family)
MVQKTDSEVVFADSQGEALIRKTAGVCGGDACIRNSRIMVWLLVAERRAEKKDQEILRSHPTLTEQDLDAAWKYASQNPEEIELAISRQEDEEN